MTNISKIRPRCSPTLHECEHLSSCLSVNVRGEAVMQRRIVGASVIILLSLCLNFLLCSLSTKEMENSVTAEHILPHVCTVHLSQGSSPLNSVFCSFVLPPNLSVTSQALVTIGNASITISSKPGGLIVSRPGGGFHTGHNNCPTHQPRLSLYTIL